MEALEVVNGVNNDEGMWVVGGQGVLDLTHHAGEL